MLKAFDGRVFQPPQGILPKIPVELGGQIVHIVNARIDYHMILGQNWFYAMSSIASSVFYLLKL